MDRRETAIRFLDALARQDFDAVGRCFAKDASMSALTPHRLREHAGREETAARYAYWFGSLDPFEILESDAAEIVDRVRIRYLIRGRHPVDGWRTNEHTAYATVENGEITTMRLACTGFRPADPPA